MIKWIINKLKFEFWSNILRNCVSDCGSNNFDFNIMILFVFGWVVEIW